MFSRDFREAVRVLGIVRTLWYRTGYRPFMRWAHRHGWHHAPANRVLRSEQGALARCSWCGLSGFIWDAQAANEAAGRLAREEQVRSEPQASEPQQAKRAS